MIYLLAIKGQTFNLNWRSLNTTYTICLPIQTLYTIMILQTNENTLYNQIMKFQLILMISQRRSKWLHMLCHSFSGQSVNYVTSEKRKICTKRISLFKKCCLNWTCFLIKCKYPDEEFIENIIIHCCHAQLRQSLMDGVWWNEFPFTSRCQQMINATITFTFFFHYFILLM